jgi:hypothetical protein
MGTGHMATIEFLERLKAWSDAGAGNPTERIDKRFVHKTDARNVFITRVTAVSQDDPDQHFAELGIDSQHPYHFEHAQDHVPGMMLVEAGRQLAMAIAHLYFEVPLKSVFVINEVSITFHHFADLGRPIYIHSVVRDKAFRRDQLVAMSSGGDFIQNGEVLGSMSGRWTMFDRALIERMRRRRNGRPAAAAESAATEVDAPSSRVG